MSKLLSPGARETFRFGLLQFLYYASIVSFEGFLVPWLRRQGYNPARTGLVMSAIFVFAVFGQPLWGHLCDRIGKHKLVVAGSLLFAAGVALLLPLAVTLFPVVLLLALAYSATANSMPGNIDGWIMARRAVVPRIEYGVARGMGSLGFAVAALGLGFLYQRFGLGTMFPAYALIAVAAATVALVTPDSASGTHAVPDLEAAMSRPLLPQTPHSLKAAALAVVTHREYRVFAASAVLLFIAFRAAMTFLPELVLEIGGVDSHIGAAHSVGAFSEIPIMLLAAVLVHRFKADRLVLVAMLVFTARMSLYAFLRTPEALVIAQALHGPSFGLFIAASVHYIDEISPSGHKSLFLALAPSLYFGAGSVIGSALAGQVVQHLGLHALYVVVPVVVAFATALFAIMGLRPRSGNAGS